MYKIQKKNNNFLLVTGNCKIISMSITRAFGHNQRRFFLLSCELHSIYSVIFHVQFLIRLLSHGICLEKSSAGGFQLVSCRSCLLTHNRRFDETITMTLGSALQVQTDALLINLCGYLNTSEWKVPDLMFQRDIQDHY